MKGLLALLRLWWDICRFKRDPEDVPYSPTLLIVVAMFQWALAYAAWTDSKNWQYGLLAATLYVGTLLLLPYVILLAAHKTARYVQMQAALLGTSLLLNLVAALLIISSRFLAQAIPFLEYLVVVVITVMVIWAVAVQGRIYQSALEKSRLVAICIAIFVLLASSKIFDWMMHLLQWVKADFL
ncbi:MAG: hypothetical protein K0R48_1155 [Gammaproteobacteria bacterium]|jgi:3-hydroxymyristoyl/3-hydroxydecanoyl-(acyl carrier protein) dehydratase|nr:hypothetical protein [Gammaproteobacteria bacterium]